MNYWRQDGQVRAGFRLFVGVGSVLALLLGMLDIAAGGPSRRDSTSPEENGVEAALRGQPAPDVRLGSVHEATEFSYNLEVTIKGTSATSTSMIGSDDTTMPASSPTTWLTTTAPPTTLFSTTVPQTTLFSTTVPQTTTPSTDRPPTSVPPTISGPVGSDPIDDHGDPFLTKMMTTAGESGSSPRFSGGPWTTNNAVTQFSSGESLRAQTSGGRGDILTYGTGADLIVSWTWANHGSDHNAPNSELQVTALYAEVLDGRDNKWKVAWGPLTIGASYKWAEAPLHLPTGSLDRGMNSAGNPIAAFSYDLDQYGLEAWQTGYASAVERQVDAGLIQNAKVYRIRGLVRVAKRPNATSDDRSGSRFLVQQGFDLMNSTHPAFPSQQLQPGSSFARAGVGTYPGSAVDGGNGRWFLVPFDAARPDIWYPFGVVSITDPFWPAMYQDPWAKALGCAEWRCPNDQAGTGGLSAAEYEQSKPPAIGF